MVVRSACEGKTADMPLDFTRNKAVGHIIHTSTSISLNCRPQQTDSTHCRNNRLVKICKMLTTHVLRSVTCVTMTHPLFGTLGRHVVRDTPTDAFINSRCRTIEKYTRSTKIPCRVTVVIYFQVERQKEKTSAYRIAISSPDNCLSRSNGS